VARRRRSSESSRPSIRDIVQLDTWPAQSAKNGNYHVTCSKCGGRVDLPDDEPRDLWKVAACDACEAIRLVVEEEGILPRMFEVGPPQKVNELQVPMQLELAQTWARDHLAVDRRDNVPWLRMIIKEVDKLKKALAAGDIGAAVAATQDANHAIGQLKYAPLMQEGMKVRQARKAGSEVSRQKFARERKGLQKKIDQYCADGHSFDRACQLVADDRQNAGLSPSSKSWVKKNTLNRHIK